MINKKMMQNLIIVGVVIFLVVSAVYIILRQANNKDDVVVPTDNNEVNKIEQVEQEIMKASQNILEEIKEVEISDVEKINSSDYVIGNLGAPVEIIIYNDFNCPFFEQFNNTIEEIKKEFGEQTVIAFRHFLLDINSISMQAALASECASEQGKFWEMYDRLLEDNKLKKMNEEQFKKDVLELGLNTINFNVCLDEEKYKDRILEQVKEAKQANVVGAPTTFINGQQLPGAYPFLDFTREDGEQVPGMKSVIENYLSK